MMTLLLDRSTNDLCLDASGNLAVASDPYSIIQDVASACAVFKGELWYNTTQGIPYRSSILGHNPPIAFLKALFVAAALTVPGVAQAQCFISSTANREVHGQVQVLTAAGQAGVIELNGPSPPYPSAIITDTGAFVLTDLGFTVIT